MDDKTYLKEYPELKRLYIETICICCKGDWGVLSKKELKSFIEITNKAIQGIGVEFSLKCNTQKEMRDYAKFISDRIKRDIEIIEELAIVKNDNPLRRNLKNCLDDLLKPFIDFVYDTNEHYDATLDNEGDTSFQKARKKLIESTQPQQTEKRKWQWNDEYQSELFLLAYSLSELTKYFRQEQGSQYSKEAFIMDFMYLFGYEDKKPGNVKSSRRNTFENTAPIGEEIKEFGEIVLAMIVKTNEPILEDIAEKAKQIIANNKKKKYDS